MFHLTGSMSPFRSLYEHGRMVVRAPLSFLAAQNSSAVFYYICEISVNLNELSYVFLSLNVPRSASMEEIPAEEEDVVEYWSDCDPGTSDFQHSQFVTNSISLIP